MCGRLNIHDSALVRQLMDTLGLPLFPERAPRYNITPMSTLDVLTHERHIAEMQWSIEFGKFRHPNTKIETISRRKDLQRLLVASRCIVPVNRFYEWPDAKVRPKYAGIKTRFCIHTPHDVMFLGGIHKANEKGEEQVNILTTDPNAAINDFHHRMPVVIPPEHVNDWLNSNRIDDLFALAHPYSGELVIYECDVYVDNGRHNGPQCMAPAT